MIRAAVLVAALAGGVLAACGSSSDSSTTTVSTPTGGVVRPEGFASAEIVIRRADGSACTLCTYLARNTAEWQRGLMNATDLDGRDGMLFQFPTPNTNRFWMRDTVLPLTGVWFGADGGFIEAIDMAPCPDDEPNCPLYGPDRPAATVLELPLGTLEGLRIGEGSRLESIGATCNGQTSN